MTHAAHNLDRMFRPRSIAVVGASRHPAKLGAIVYRNIRSGGFRGQMFAVNIKGGTLDGHRVFQRVLDLPSAVDLAVIVTPATVVPGILEECGTKGIGNVVVISAGFREVGSEGKERELLLQEIIVRYSINLLGPNCLGFAIGDSRLNASFGSPLAQGGSLGLISQSGAMAVALTDWAEKQGIGIRTVISMGNKAGLTEIELLRYVARDPETQLIVLYLESMERGQEFLALAKRVVRRKPIVVLKAGESPASSKAVHFHTGALAGDTEILNAALRQACVHQAHSLRDLDRLVVSLQSARVPQSNRIAIITNAGGPGILAMDAMSHTTLRRAALSQNTKDQLHEVLPAAASLANPIDIIGDAEPKRFALAVKCVLADSSVDAAVVLLTPQVMTRPTEVARHMVTSLRTSGKKTITAAFLGGAHVTEARAILTKAGIANFDVPEDAVMAMEDLWLQHQAAFLSGSVRSQSPVSIAPSVRSLLQKPAILLYPDADAVLEEIGLKSAPAKLVDSSRKALSAARGLGFPITLKWISAKMLHKTDKGGVIADIRSADELESALRKLQRLLGVRQPKKHEGWLVQKHIAGTEVFLGAKRDGSFGPVVLVGVGGTDTEIIKVAVPCLPPFTKHNVHHAINSDENLLRWLTQRRGKVPVDIDALAVLAANLGKLLEAAPEIAEVDINPLMMVDGEKSIVVDARIRITHSL